MTRELKEGEKFGKLTVVGDAGKDKYRKKMVYVECECGCLKQVRNEYLLAGHKNKCEGCKNHAS